MFKNSLIRELPVVVSLFDLFEFVFQDKEPIKTIDLEDCQEVARDDSLGKGNCFR